MIGIHQTESSTKVLKIGTVVGQKYKLECLLNSGSINEYWRATDQVLDRSVIIKVMLESPNGEFKDETSGLNRKRIFRHDASLLAQLEHPNILPIYDIGQHHHATSDKEEGKDERISNRDDVDDPILYIVTRDIRGCSLYEAVTSPKEQTKLQSTLSSIAQFASRIGSLIDFIHENNVIHGDINPNNILIGRQEQPYLSNFTVAAMRRESPNNVIAGTAGFVAPELHGDNNNNNNNNSAKQATELCDIYSFGVLLYFVFTKTWPPISSTSRFGLKDRVLPSVRKYRPELPVSVDVLIQRLTHYDPMKRIPTAMRAVEELQNIVFANHKTATIDGKVFISYASKDRQIVHPIVKELQNVGISVWIDSTGIIPGTTWAEGIQSALRDCTMMLLFVTDNSMSSDYVTHEWSYFMGSQKTVYPFVVNGTLPKNIHPRLEHFQFAFGTKEGNNDDVLNNVARIVNMLSM